MNKTTSFTTFTKYSLNIFIKIKFTIKKYSQMFLVRAFLGNVNILRQREGVAGSQLIDKVGVGLIK